MFRSIRFRPKETAASTEMSSGQDRPARAGKILMAGQVGASAIRFLGGIILARLLTPEDFGLVGMVAIFITFTMIFNELGISAAIVQKKSLLDSQTSNLFWITIIVSIVASSALAACAPLIAAFFENGQLIEIVRVLALGIFIQGFGMVHNALLSRNMRFVHLTVISLTSTIIGLLAAIALAFNGWGYWSLIFQSLATSIVQSTATVFVVKWRPRLPARKVGTKSLLNTATNLLTFNVFNFFTRNADNILVGKYLGPETLGIYSRAYKLFILPIQQICVPMGKATFPALCRSAPDDESRLREIYLTTTGLLSALISPGCLILAACSDWVIAILLGSQWNDVAPIVSVLALLGALQAATTSCGNLLTACGKTKALSRWGFISSILTVSSFVAGLPWGALGVATAYSLSGIIIRTPILLRIVEKNTPVSMKSILLSMAKPVLFGTAGATVTITIRLAAPDLPALMGCLAFALIILATYLALFFSGGKILLTNFRNLT